MWQQRPHADVEKSIILLDIIYEHNRERSLFVVTATLRCRLGQLRKKAEKMLFNYCSFTNYRVTVCWLGNISANFGAISFGVSPL